ncbi:MAG: DNA-3-methyladenine glycosylase 2 family protein [Ruminococcaceae bacterium]|nr:DNA-3-methyladenine glycosylase 2 family protein [Oscillospiraceae bacterium]
MIATTEIIRKTENSVTVKPNGNFSVRKTFDCGQAFRFDPVEKNEDHFCGIAFGKKVEFIGADSELTIIGSTEEEYLSHWRHYLALDEDYDEIDRMILDAMPSDRDREIMARAVECGRGIRILRQDPFECLISFIVSQNNNIPRIKKIIAALCDNFGENGAFPTPAALADAGEAAIFALKTGFRAAYIHDAAKKVLSGEVDLDFIKNCTDYDRCTEELCKIKGVGPKVSSCALLFGFGKTEAFPIDVWMKRSLERHFPDGFDHTSLGRAAGIAQQYLFYYERYIGE